MHRSGAEPCSIATGNDRVVKRQAPSRSVGESAFLVDKGNHQATSCSKEIHEQPEVISPHAVELSSIMVERGAYLLPDLGIDLAKRAARDDLGLRYGLSTQGLVGEVLARALCAGAGRDRCGVGDALPRGADAARAGVALFVSQSGETADTLATLRYCTCHTGQRIALQS
jgi:glucosamine--fructose-6-phosphate aminotransferase (isomerizing)